MVFDDFVKYESIIWKQDSRDGGKNLTRSSRCDILYWYVGIWCSGNTQDFDSCIVGSNPAIPAKRTDRLTRSFLFLLKNITVCGKIK